MTADASMRPEKAGGAGAALRLLWLTENYPPDRGGMAQSCDRIVRNLRRAGAEVVVAYLGRRASDWTVEPRERGAEIRGPADDDAGHAINRLWSLVKAQQAAAPFSHVVAFGGAFPLLAAPPFAAWLGAPLVTLVRGNDFDTGVFSPRRGDVVREALARAAFVGAVTTEQVQKIRALHPGVRVGWTPNGIDAADWRLLPADRARGQAWRAAEVAPGRRAVGLFGQLKQKKGTLFLLECLWASGRAGDVHVLVVGDVEESVVAWLRERASEGERPLAHTLLPFRDRFDLLPLYAAVDLIAVPSFYDGMPNVLLEAAALGVPVLGSDAGAMPDVLGADAPFLFAAGDRASCRLAVERALACDAAGLARAGEAARLRTAERFSAAAETRRYLEVLAQATGSFREART
jgi:glycosyltransferase involved in cell wall biosynthesis